MQLDGTSLNTVDPCVSPTNNANSFFEEACKTVMFLRRNRNTSQ